MFREKVFAIAAPLLFLFLMFPPAGFSEDSADCVSCHYSMQGRIKAESGRFIELRVDAERYKASVHATLACRECHAGFGATAHASAGRSAPSHLLSLSAQLSPKFRSDAVAGAACITCHEEMYEKVLSSVHGKNIIEKKQSDGALCLDCHGSPHYITRVKDGNSPMSRKYQVETCLGCHADQGITDKYNLEGNVMESFKVSFHGRKLHLGHTRAPSCSSCHNGHDIKSKTDPESPVFGKNKLETCGKCHKGANEKFVQAITHKKPGPIPHYGEKFLILLTIGTFAFIVLHVLLEVFADIRDAIFRKKEGK